jgi:AcrR family transcriptional regulator
LARGVRYACHAQRIRVIARIRYSHCSGPIIRTTTPLNARKKPRQQRSVATVEAVLEAAARILEKQGFAGYNTNDIARVAGIGVGSLYHYFPNKDAITSALVLREMGALSRALEGLKAIPAGCPRVQHLIEIAVEHQLGRSKLSRLLDLEEERLALADNLAEGRTSMMALIRDALADLPENHAEAEFAAEDVVAIIRGMVDSAGSRGESNGAVLIERITRAVLGYLNGPAR